MKICPMCKTQFPNELQLEQCPTCYPGGRLKTNGRKLLKSELWMVTLFDENELEQKCRDIRGFQSFWNLPPCALLGEDVSTTKLPNTPQVPHQIHCPKCGSDQITAVNRKWSIWTGFLTNKTDRFCLNCKHKW